MDCEEKLQKIIEKANRTCVEIIAISKRVRDLEYITNKLTNIAAANTEHLKLSDFDIEHRKDRIKILEEKMYKLERSLMQSRPIPEEEKNGTSDFCFKKE